jgi:chorismate synthase
VTLELATAGESHGPALVGILSGLPAGLLLDRDAINGDLHRRQQGYGRSPRQQLEHDEVRMLAGLRHGRTLGSPLGFLIENRDHENWQWGMGPWPPEGGPSGKGTNPVTVPRPGHADLAGALKYGLADARDALERASARQTAVTVAAGAIAKALLAEIKVELTGRVLESGDVDEAKADRDTVGGIVEVHARGVPPGLGSYATKEGRLDGRLAAAVLGIQAVKGVEIGDGFALARLRGSAAHDEIFKEEHGLYRETNRAGGIEGGISNGEPIIVRAAQKPVSTLRTPLPSLDLTTGEPGRAHIERSDVTVLARAAIVGEAMVGLVLADELLYSFGGDTIGDLRAAVARRRRRTRRR